jgi:putative MATE family efflux protein
MTKAENKMGVMPVNKLLLSMAVPIMISMMVQAFYNVVDSYFVAKVSENALTAVSMAFPIQNLMIAVGSGVGVGMNALLSRALGEKKEQEASHFAMQGIFLLLAGYVLFLIIGLFFTRLFMASQTDIAEIVDYGVDYLKVCCCFSFGLFGQFAFERISQGTGRTIDSMISQTVGAVANIILDPIFIFGIGFVPKMGVTGAAIATVIGQILGAAVGLFLNLTKNKEIHFSFRDILPDWPVAGRILKIGVPSILMASVSSLTTYVLNRILGVFTSTAVAVFGAYFKLQSFIFMPVFGLNNGMVPIIAYNFGARQKDRVNQTIRLSMTYAVTIMLIGLAVFQLLPDKLLLLFEASEQMLAIGIPALRIISLSFALAGVNVIAGSVCQALDRSMYSLILSAGRQLVILLPAAYLLSLTGNIDLVWFSFPLAEVVALVLSIILLKKALKQLDWN